jgi:hypothetical protein
MGAGLYSAGFGGWLDALVNTGAWGPGLGLCSAGLTGGLAAVIEVDLFSFGFRAAPAALLFVFIFRK